MPWWFPTEVITWQTNVWHASWRVRPKKPNCTCRVTSCRDRAQISWRPLQVRIRTKGREKGVICQSILSTRIIGVTLMFLRWHKCCQFFLSFLRPRIYVTTNPLTSLVPHNRKLRITNCLSQTLSYLFVYYPFTPSYISIHKWNQHYFNNQLISFFFF